MYQPKPVFTKVLMSVLTVALASGAVFGNGSIQAVIARFQSFRTVPNILIANLAFVDLLNAAINMPIHMLYTILEVSWFKGQSLAIVTCFFNRLFIILNLASMLALMANMYFAIAFKLTYFAWKSNKKAVVCSFLIWFIGTLVVVLYSLPLLSIDLGDTHVAEYRAEIYKQGKQHVAVFMVVFIICGGVLSFLVTRSIKKKKAKICQLTY